MNGSAISTIPWQYGFRKRFGIIKKYNLKEKKL